MKIKTTRRFTILLIIFLSILIYLLVNLHSWSRQHVDYITAGQPHPLNCLPCHVSPQRTGFLADLLNKDYLSPFNLAISPQGKQLYITAQGEDVLIVVDLESKEVESLIPVGDRPHSVVVSEDGKTGYVSNQWSNSLSVINLVDKIVIDTIEVGGGPAGIAFGKGGRFLYVANSYTYDISVIDLTTHNEIRRLTAGNNPTGVQAAPGGDSIYVTSRRSLPVPYRTTPITEVTVVDANRHQVAKRNMIPSAHIFENVDFTPSGDLAIVTLVRPKNLVPAVQLERGWMINHGIAVIERKNKGRIIQLLLDEPNKFYSDPFDIVISADGKYAFVTHSGADFISVISIDKIREILSTAGPDITDLGNHLGLSSQFVVKRIPTGPNPKGLVLSPDGKTLFVAERLADRITEINTETLEPVGTIDLGGLDQTTLVRKGAQLFNNASHTFHQQYSCYTCHPDGHEDGLIYDMSIGMGRNLANVQTLRDLTGTAPFKWNGKNVSIYMQCGMRFSRFVTRTESFSPGDLNALVSYIKRELTHPPNYYQNQSFGLTPAQMRGKEIYQRAVTNDGKEIPVDNRCITCHPPPNFTNRLLSNVGTLSEIDDPMQFDAPNLNNVYESAPYLHDGRATTLEEIWTKYNDEDQHGVANDLSKDQLNDLIEYLRSLGPASTYKD